MTLDIDTLVRGSLATVIPKRLLYAYSEHAGTVKGANIMQTLVDDLSFVLYDRLEEETKLLFTQTNTIAVCTSRNGPLHELLTELFETGQTTKRTLDVVFPKELLSAHGCDPFHFEADINASWDGIAKVSYDYDTGKLDIVLQGISE